LTLDWLDKKDFELVHILDNLSQAGDDSSERSKGSKAPALQAKGPA